MFSNQDLKPPKYSTSFVIIGLYFEHKICSIHSMFRVKRSSSCEKKNCKTYFLECNLKLVHVRVCVCVCVCVSLCLCVCVCLPNGIVPLLCVLLP